MTPLYTYRRESVPLADALAAFAGLGSAEAVALVYAPRWCGFARLAGGRLTDHAGAAPADAYEVRVFHAAAELRWRKDPAADGPGSAAVVTDDDFALPGWTAARREVNRDHAVTYLIWGEAAAAPQPLPAGWSLLGAARVGGLPIPVSGLATGRGRLSAVEYVAEDEFGSAFVCEERLTRLEVENDRG